MEYWIFIASIVPLCAFICMLPVVLRIVSEETSIRAIFTTALVCLVFAIGCWVYIVLTYMNPCSKHLVDILTGFLFVMSIYAAGVVLFIFSIFVTLEGSLTLRFLHIIGSSSSGISKLELLKRYSIAQIIDRRLKRLCASGDIRVQNGQYMLGPHQSYFRLRERFFALYWSCFP